MTRCPSFYKSSKNKLTIVKDQERARLYISFLGKLTTSNSFASFAANLHTDQSRIGVNFPGMEVIFSLNFVPPKKDVELCNN